MTPRERIVRLEGLLDRVQRNASRPRARPAPPASKSPAAAAPAPAVSTPAAPPVVARPPFAAPPPPAAAPPPPPPLIEAEAPRPQSAPPWQAEPTSTVQARPSSMPPEELSEDDLVDVTTVPPPDVPRVAASASSPAEEESPSGDFAASEEPPASSRRSKVAESLDQAIASAAAQADEHEVPIHTPPPESGPQEAALPAGLEAPRAPAFGELATDLVRPASLGPTTEQLGETIELEGSESPDIEIEVGGLPTPERAPERPVEELEVALPRAEMPSGTYDVDVSMPAAAAPIAASAAPTAPAVAHSPPEITARPGFVAAEVAHVVRVSEKAPENFGELLELALKL